MLLMSSHARELPRIARLVCGTAISAVKRQTIAKEKVPVTNWCAKGWQKLVEKIATVEDMMYYRT